MRSDVRPRSRDARRGGVALSRRRPLPWRWWLPTAVVGVALGAEATIVFGETARAPLVMALLLAPFGLVAHRRVGSLLLVGAVLALVGHAQASGLVRRPPAVVGEALGARVVRGRVRDIRSGTWGGRARWARLEIEVLSTARPRGGPRAGDGIRLSIGRSDGSWELGDAIEVRVKPRPARGFCNDRRDGWTRWLAKRGVGWTAWVRDDGAVTRAAPEANGSLGSRSAQLRGHIGRAIDGSVGDPAAAVLRALVIGDKGRLTADLRETFARTGTAHLLAVSGMHLAIVAGATFVGAKLVLALGVGRWAGWPLGLVAAPISLAVAAAYAVLTGGAVATLRALIMASFVFAGLSLRRRSSAVPALLAAAGILVVREPDVLRDLSFQLSFVSVAGLLAVATRVRGTRLGSAMASGTERGWRLRAMAWTLRGVVASLAAGLATAPMGAHYFGVVSLVGVVGNLIIGPILGVGALGAALAGALVVGVSPALADALFRLAGELVDVALAVAGVLGASRFAAVSLEKPGAALAAASTLALAALFVPRRPWRWLAWSGCVLLAAAPGWALQGKAGLRFSVLDVGQGDALLLESGSGDIWVVDAGGLGGDFDTGVGVVLPALSARPGRRLRAVVLTHADRDHYGGLQAIVEAGAPGEFWWNGRVSDGSRFRALRAAIAARPVSDRVLAAGTRVEGTGLDWLVLHPPHAATTLSRNDASLVFAVRYGATRILLAGDIEARGERLLRKSGYDLSATIMKVPHHGSRSSSTSRLLDAVQPSLAVASLGTFNRFGFPAPEVPARYRAGGSRWRATGTWGEIVVASDGQLERVETCRSG